MWQTPAYYARSEPSFQQLALNPDPALAARLAANNVGNVSKVWTELAYDEVRRDIAPDRPSRLDSLFAFVDPIEAFLFLDESTTARQVWRGTVQPGIKWCVVDMAIFGVLPQPPDLSEDAFARAWTETVNAAGAYWRPANPTAVGLAEVLVAGPIQLAPPMLSLRTTLAVAGFRIDSAGTGVDEGLTEEN